MNAILPTTQPTAPHPVRIMPEHGGRGVSVDGENYTRVIENDQQSAISYGLELARASASLVILHDAEGHVEVYS